VTEVRRHLERIYGKGLVGLFDDDGNFDQKRLSWARTRPAANWVQVGETQINAENVSSWFYGLSQGLQYNAMEAGNKAKDNEEANNCFFALYGLTDSVDMFTYDAINMFATSGSVNWFNVVGYSPIQMMGNMSVVYEYCGGYQYADQLTSYGSLDYGFMAERFSRDVTYLMSTWPAMMKEKAEYSTKEVQKKAPKKKDYALNADTATSLQWDMSDVAEQGAEISETIPKNQFAVGKIWGEVVGAMMGTTLSPET